MSNDVVTDAKAAAKHHRDHASEHFVYRCYDEAGRLLYIGCAMDVEARMQVHASSWRNPVSAQLNLRMARYDVAGPYVGRLAGRQVERDAIAGESPLLNTHHNRGRAT